MFSNDNMDHTSLDIQNDDTDSSVFILHLCWKYPEDILKIVEEDEYQFGQNIVDGHRPFIRIKMIPIKYVFDDHLDVSEKTEDMPLKTDMGLLSVD